MKDSFQPISMLILAPFNKKKRLIEPLRKHLMNQHNDLFNQLKALDESNNKASDSTSSDSETELASKKWPKQGQDAVIPEIQNIRTQNLSQAQDVFTLRRNTD